MKKFMLSIFLKLLLIGLVACSAKPTVEKPPESLSFIESLNEFNFDLYRKISVGDKNIISSPYSLSSLLTISALGAGGNTRAELLNVLHMKDVSEIENNLSKTSLLGANNETAIANSLWGEKNLEYKDAFLKIIKKSQGNHFFTIDYAKNPELARQTINTWVEKNTQNYIKNLLPPNSLTVDTRLVLVNAIYFKDHWKMPFDKNYSENKFFKLTNGDTIPVPMMYQKNNFSYAENETLQWLILPYEKSNLAMLVLLPKTNHNLQQLKKSLNTTTFSTLLTNAMAQKVEVTLPTFTLESTFDDLKDSLSGMGLVEVFTNSADFSNMVNGALSFSTVIQKAFIKVDEEGTTATAATTMIGIGSIAENPSKIPVFFADHPFLFIIYDTESKIILFIGQVTHP